MAAEATGELSKRERSLPPAIEGSLSTWQVEEGFAALLAGDLDRAEERFTVALAAETHPGARVIEGLGVCQQRRFAWSEACRTMEQAFAAYVEEGDLRQAVLVGATIVGLCANLGEESAARGWEQRSLRLAAGVDPCVERGYLALARVGCEVRDAGTLEENADLALGLAVEFGDRELEIRALADKGLALVSKGQVDQGFALLDEVMVRLDADEAKNPIVVGFSLCAMLAACERAGDISRADYFCERMNHLVVLPAAHLVHCRVTYGSILAIQGRWESAEANLLDAVRISGPYTRRRRYAIARLADIRIQLGRLDEAADMLEEHDESAEVAYVIGKLRYAQGRLDDSVGVLRSAARALRQDRLQLAPVLSLMVKVELARADLIGARRAVKQLDDLNLECDSNEIRAMARLAAGRIAMEAKDPSRAVDEFDTALTLLVHTERPMLTAEIRLEFAQALHQVGDSAAAVEAAAALKTFQKLGAATDAQRARQLLSKVEDTNRSSAAPNPAHMRGVFEVLTKREAQVAGLVAQGLANREIAEQLFLSIRTIETHVDRILGKLDLHSRTGVAASLASASRRGRAR